MPEVLELGQVYVSIEHATIVHLCACGCGSEVVLPLSPLDWRLTWNGEQISVSPSVGSWSLPCRSHYFIDGGRVRWAGGWSDEKVQAGRNCDRRLKEQRYGADLARDPLPPPMPAVAEAPLVESRPRGWLGWLRRIGRRR